jgi:hypothetical protein
VLATALDQTKVPAEFRGIARLFRNEVRAADVRMDAALAAIAAPLHARLRRHPRLREEQVAAAVKVYARDVPVAFRISSGIEACRDRARFAIAEVRLTATWMNARAWADDDATDANMHAIDTEDAD